MAGIYSKMPDKKMDRNTKDIKLQSAVDKILDSEWKRVSGCEDAENSLIVKDRIWNGIRRKMLYKRVIISSLSAAACISAVLVSFFMLRQESATDNFDNIIMAENQQIYVLPDSSKVYLENGSCIKFNDSFAENREIWLDGNSTFDVRKTGGSPFRVHLEGGVIKVKGTSFYVEQDDADETSVMLYNGKIDYTPSTGGNAVELKPSQILVHNTASNIIAVSQASAKIKWNEGKYNFIDIPLRDFARFLTNRYDADIRIHTNAERPYSITGSISYDESLKSVIEKICFSLNLKYEECAGTYILSE